jgi:hypothetical protein
VVSDLELDLDRARAFLQLPDEQRTIFNLARDFQAIRDAETEECAKVAEKTPGVNAGYRAACAIRARIGKEG